MKIALMVLFLLLCPGVVFSEVCEPNTLFEKENSRLKNIEVTTLEKLIPLSVWGETIYLPNRYLVRMKKGQEGFSLSTYSSGLESYFQCEFEGEQFLYGSIDVGVFDDCLLCKEIESATKLKVEKFTFEGGFYMWTYYVPNARPIVLIFDHAKYMKVVDRNDFLSKSIVQQLGLKHKH